MLYRVDAQGPTLRALSMVALLVATLVVPSTPAAASLQPESADVATGYSALADLGLEESIGFAVDPDSVDSIPSFWGTRFADAFDGEYRDPSAIHAYQHLSGPVPDTACLLTDEDVAGNGVYCFEDESITIDVALLQLVGDAYGPAAAIAILAHEWGHHIQRLTARPERDQRAELQADCYAGMYLAHLVDRGVIDGADVLGSIEFIELAGDELTGPGADLAWFDPERHGAAHQRRQAHGIGYSTGDPSYCRTYDRWAYEPPIPLAVDLSGARLAPLLHLPPGSNSRLTADGARIIDMPGNETTVHLTRIPPGDNPADAIATLVHDALGAEARVSGITEGWLETLGWATSTGARSRFDRTLDDGATAVGAVGLQVHRDGTAELFVATSRSGDAEAAARALDALAWGYCDPSAPVRSNCGSAAAALPTPRPIAVPTPAPVVLPTPRPITVPRPTARPPRRPSPRELRQDLHESIPWVSDCQDWTQSQVANDPFEAGSRAAILCEDPGPRVDYLALYRFDRAEDMNRYWRRRISQIDPSVSVRRSACADGRPGIRSWRHGSLVCYVSSNSRVAVLRWTDRRTNTYGILDATNGSLRSLFRHWGRLRP